MQERRPLAALSPAVRNGASRRVVLPALVAAAVVVLDQLTKAWALRALADGPVPLVWTLRLRLSFNSGVAFGLGEGFGPLLVVVGVVVLVALLVLGRSLAAGATGRAALGLVLGGAAGNLVDRFTRGGEVVDFVDLGWWPVFNLADAAITVGAVLLVLTTRDDGRG